MYKVSVPISIKSISDTEMEKDLKKYLDYFTRGKIDRVMVCSILPTYFAGCEIETEYDKFKEQYAFLRITGWKSVYGLADLSVGYEEGYIEKHIKILIYRKM